MFRNLEEIVAPYQGILLDAYGVFWAGNARGLYPGAMEAMRRLVREGKRVGIVSNSSQLSSKEMSKLAQHGLSLDVHYHFYLTSGDMAKKLWMHGRLPFPTPRGTYFAFGDPHPRFASHKVLFESTGFQETDELQQADFILPLIPHIAGLDQTDPDIFREKMTPLRDCSLPMLCINPDHFSHEGEPPQLVVRQGSIARIYEEIGGKVHYIGKPGPLMFDEAAELFQNVSRQQMLMIGDTPETDIRGANRCHIDAALIMDTGIMSERITAQGVEEAVRNIASSDIPRFYIRKLT